MCALCATIALKPATRAMPEVPSRNSAKCCSRSMLKLRQAPVKPKSAVGEMLAYYYQAQPHLFKEVIERQFAVLAEERDAKEAAEREQREQAAEASEGAATSSMDLTLYRSGAYLGAVCISDACRAS